MDEQGQSLLEYALILVLLLVVVIVVLTVLGVQVSTTFQSLVDAMEF